MSYFTVHPVMSSDCASLPNAVPLGADAPPGTIMHGLVCGLLGLGSDGTFVIGCVRSSAIKMFPTSEEASRAVNGGRPNLHSISFRTEV